MSRRDLATIALVIATCAAMIVFMPRQAQPACIELGAVDRLFQPCH